jgi:D-lactate dehydrogenase
VVDQSPCARALRQAGSDLPGEQRERHRALDIRDGIDWAHDVVLPRLRSAVPGRDVRTVAVHPVCSIRDSETARKLEALARALAGRAVVPANAGCCGFAGDRGFLVPELTASATRAEADEIVAGAFDGHYSSSRTCEIGLARATGRPWHSFWALFDEATRG